MPDPGKVQIPGKAVAIAGAGSEDISQPIVDLLGKLNILPSSTQLEAAGKFSAAFGGPSQSVAVIESNATALSKWWAAGLGATVLGGWGSVVKFWNANSAQPANQRALVVGIAIASAAAVLAIGYILGSDVRGRSAAMVATITARAHLSDAMISAAVSKFQPAAAAPAQIIALPAALRVRWVTKEGPDERGWQAIALKVDRDDNKYLVVKGTTQDWAPVADVRVEELPNE